MDKYIVSLFLVTTDADRALCFAVRRTVFTDEQGVPEAIERDSDDLKETTLHFLGLRNGVEPIAAARVVDKGDGVAKIGRVAVLAEARGLRIGEQLMEFVLLTLEVRGFTEAILHAQLPVVGFYERLGFVATGDVFYEAEIPHRAMARTL